MKFSKCCLLALLLIIASTDMIVDARRATGGGSTTVRTTRKTTYTPGSTTIVRSSPGVYVSPVIVGGYGYGGLHSGVYYSHPMSVSEITGVIVGVLVFCAICICIGACKNAAGISDYEEVVIH